MLALRPPQRDDDGIDAHSRLRNNVISTGTSDAATPGQRQQERPIRASSRTPSRTLQRTVATASGVRPGALTRTWPTKLSHTTQSWVCQVPYHRTQPYNTTDSTSSRVNWICVSAFWLMAKKVQYSSKIGRGALGPSVNKPKLLLYRRKSHCTIKRKKQVKVCWHDLC